MCDIENRNFLNQEYIECYFSTKRLVLDQRNMFVWGGIFIFDIMICIKAVPNLMYYRFFAPIIFKARITKPSRPWFSQTLGLVKSRI